MKRRNFIKQAGAASLVAGTGLAAACSTSTTENNVASSQGEIAHYVLFWLKEGLSAEEKESFTDFFEMLRPIPGIKALYYGKPVATTPRPVVDNSFSYNLVVFFDSMEELDVYENHPIHLEAIEKFSHNWEKVVVHDSLLK